MPKFCKLKRNYLIQFKKVFDFVLAEPCINDTD
jgi:hypothetical protein